MTQRMGRPRGLLPDGPAIRRLRVGLGLTSVQMAAQLGIHKGSYMALEGERRRIGDVSASRLARMLGVTVEDITRQPGDDTGSDAKPKALAS